MRTILITYVLLALALPISLILSAPDWWLALGAVAFFLVALLSEPVGRRILRYLHS